MTSLPYFQFTASYEQSGSRIPDAYSVKLMFYLMVAFYLTKANRTKKNSNQALTLLL